MRKVGQIAKTRIYRISLFNWEFPYFPFLAALLKLCFLVITRHHDVGEVPGVVEMNPTSLSHLFPLLLDLISRQ